MKVFIPLYEKVILVLYEDMKIYDTIDAKSFVQFNLKERI